MILDTAPSLTPFSITPNDGANLPASIRAFSVAVGGAVKITRFDGVVDIITVPAGLCPCGVARIWAAGTTATGFTGYG